MSVSDGISIKATDVNGFLYGISMDVTIVQLCMSDSTSTRVLRSCGLVHSISTVHAASSMPISGGSTQGMTSCGRPSQYLNGARNLFDGRGRWY